MVEAVFVAPGIGVDVDAMAVLRKAVDKSDDASGAWEDGAPLFESEIGSDDCRALLVATADEIVEDVGGAVVTRQISQFVEDEQVWHKVSF